MARPIKQGFGYFPLDTSIFGDFKIQKLLEAFGAKGAAAYLFMLCAIYRENGYYVECDEKFVFNVAFFLRIKENLVREIVEYCIAVGLFEKECYGMGRILTSKGIQRRYLQICKNRKLKGGISKYNLISEETVVNVAETQVPAALTGVYPSFSTPKEKKRKEKEVDVGNGITSQYPPTPTTDFSVLASCQQLAPVDTLVSELMGEGVFREYCRMQYRLADSELDAYLERFRMFLHATDEHRKSRKDCKTHFLNWLRVQVSQDRKDRPAQERESVTAEPDARQIARVRELYPQNNFYAEKLYRNYILEHGLHPDVALEHFERAHRNGLTYGMLLFRIQTDHVMLFKN